METLASDSGSVKTMYTRRMGDRDPFLRRARSAAELTLPALMPPEGSTGSTILPTPFQGLGARGVNNLSSRLLLTLFPPNEPFFRNVVDWSDVPEIESDPKLRPLIESSLIKMEAAVKSEIDRSAIRVPVFEALKQLLIAGNILLFMPPQGGLRAFRLDRYTCKRDPMGHPVEIIVRENLHPTSLPDNVRQYCAVLHDPVAPNKDVEVYTLIERTPDRWTVRQEINGITVPGSSGHYPLDNSPWICLRFTSIDNEDYGRGLIEEYYGDLKSLEALTQAIVEGSAAAAKVLFLVNSNGSTSQKILSEAPNGAIRSGNALDVTVLHMDKFADFRVAFETIQMLQERLSQAFMLQSSVQRNGERVTAEEIRYMASELEDGLGGLYSVLGQELQLPIVRRITHQLEVAGKIPTLPKGVVKPTIITGLEALGRGHELSRLITYVQNAQAALGPEMFAAEHDAVAIYRMIGVGTGVDTKELMKTQDQKDADQRASQAQALAGAAAPQIAKGVMDNINQKQAQGPQPG